MTIGFVERLRTELKACIQPHQMISDVYEPLAADKVGCECWDALSVVPVFAKTFTNPVTGTANALFMRGIGSR